MRRRDVPGGHVTDLRMDYTVVGDTKNLAARLVQTADRGRIGLSEFTLAGTPSRPGEIQWGVAWVG